MTQTAVTYAFEQYLQTKIAAELPVTLNRFVLAYIPDLDIELPVSREEGLPDEAYIVYEQDVDQVGKVNTNALAYSIVMDTTVGDFQFNAMYLIDSADRSVGVIVHKETEQKTKTDEAQAIQGNSIVKNIMMEYTNAAELAAINVTAETWQIDYSARLLGMDEDLQDVNQDYYTHDAFIEQGFLAETTETVNQYTLKPGVAYIGGLRVETTESLNVFASTKPTYIYAVASRQGAVTSKFLNSVTTTTSTDELSDYTQDGVNYYVAKVAQVLADGTVLDLRNKSGVEEHELDADPHPQYAKNTDTGSKLDQLIAMMRKMEGKLGRVRIYAKNDIDDDYLPILGQTINKADYPDYFAHLGVTATMLTLPDWTEHPYLRQMSSDLPAGTELAQQILRHNHSASASSNGDHSHTINGTDLGTKTASTFDYGTKSSSGAGGHRHQQFADVTLGGSTQADVTSGNFPAKKAASGGIDESYAIRGSSNDATVGMTGAVGDHAHTVGIGAHNHTVNIGSHAHSAQNNGSHAHAISVGNNGGDENRPDTTVVVFAVKVKYIVSELV